MIKIEQYLSRELALEHILALDKDYTIIRHNFPKGEVIDAHMHPVDEWVVFNRGKCQISLGVETQIAEANHQAIAVYLPKNQVHGLKCLTDISYWVIRETER